MEENAVCAAATGCYTPSSPLISAGDMEVVRPSTIELEAFRNRTRGVFNKWSEQIGIRLVGEVERTIDKAK